MKLQPDTKIAQFLSKSMLPISISSSISIPSSDSDSNSNSSDKKRFFVIRLCLLLWLLCYECYVLLHSTQGHSEKIDDKIWSKG